MIAAFLLTIRSSGNALMALQPTQCRKASLLISCHARLFSGVPFAQPSSVSQSVCVPCGLRIGSPLIRVTSPVSSSYHHFLQSEHLRFASFWFVRNSRVPVRRLSADQSSQSVPAGCGPCLPIKIRTNLRNRTGCLSQSSSMIAASSYCSLEVTMWLASQIDA